MTRGLDEHTKNDFEFHIGYLNERKGVNYLIESFNKLDRKDAVLLISGTGDQEEKLKELAKDNSNIKFLGVNRAM